MDNFEVFLATIFSRSVSPNDRQGTKMTSTSTSPPLLPPPSEWSDFPVLVTQENADGEHVPCRLNESVAVSSKWFDGVATFFVRNDKDGETSPYFEGKRRKAGVLLRGKFKERIPLHEVSVGSWWEERLRFPAPFLVRTLLLALKTFLPHLGVTLGPKPHLSAPLVLDAKAMACCSREDRDWDPRPPSWPVQESTPLTGTDSKSRRKLSASFLERHSFDPDLWYTFEFYQHQCDFVSYRLAGGLGGLARVDLGKILNGQPMQFALRHEPSGNFICKFHFWSQALLRHVEKKNAGASTDTTL